VGPVHYRLHSAPHFAKFTHPHADHARDSLTSGATRKWATLLPSLDLRKAEAHPSVDDYGPQSNSELGPLSIAVAAATHALHCACLREMEAHPALSVSPPQMLHSRGARGPSASPALARPAQCRTDSSIRFALVSLASWIGGVRAGARGWAEALLWV
jgi:hypothetical protein